MILCFLLSYIKLIHSAIQAIFSVSLQHRHSWFKTFGRLIELSSFMMCCGFFSEKKVWVGNVSKSKNTSVHQCFSISFDPIKFISTVPYQCNDERKSLKLITFDFVICGKTTMSDLIRWLQLSFFRTAPTASKQKHQRCL